MGRKKLTSVVQITVEVYLEMESSENIHGLLELFLVFICPSGDKNN